MTDKPANLMVAQTVPVTRTTHPVALNADAPLLYFENAPCYGLMNGIGQITLEAAKLLGVDAGGKPIIDRAIVAHLRGNLPAMKSLRAALDGIILLAEPRRDGPAN